MVAMAALGMLGRLARTSSELALSWQVDWGEMKEEEVSFVEKVSFSGPLAFLSREFT